MENPGRGWGRKLQLGFSPPPHMCFCAFLYFPFALIFPLPGTSATGKGSIHTILLLRGPKTGPEASLMPTVVNNFCQMHAQALIQTFTNCTGPFLYWKGGKGLSQRPDGVFLFIQSKVFLEQAITPAYE